MTTLVTTVIAGALIAGAWYLVRSFKRKITDRAFSMSRLLLEGNTVTARISSVERRRLSRGHFEHYATYTFKTSGGDEHSTEVLVPTSRFDDYKAGLPIEIVYLPSDPSVNATREMVDKVRNTPDR